MKDDNFKVGDVVDTTFLDTRTMERENDYGVVVEHNADDEFKVAHVVKEKGKYYWTNQWEVKRANHMKKLPLLLTEMELEL